MTPPEQQFTDTIVRLVDYTDATLELRGLEFNRCRIVGPTVLVPMDCTFDDCSFDSPSVDALFWEIPPDRTFVVGAVAAVECTFVGCSFSQVGLGGSSETRTMIEDELRLEASQSAQTPREP